MKYIWKDYDPCEMGFVEKWIDKNTVKLTGLDDGFNEFYRYWYNEKETVPGENFWCKVVYDNEIPIAVLALGLHNNSVTVMELIVDNRKRSRGIGTAILTEIINESECIIGRKIEKSDAVIYPGNKASKRAFEKAGYVFDCADEDGDALYYVYVRGADENINP